MRERVSVAREGERGECSFFRRHARESKSGGMGARSNQFDELKKISHSYYFTNFPEVCEVKNLWQIFEGFGKVLDVFMCKRKNSKSKKLGFVRFKKDGSHSLLHKKLENVWIDSYKVFLRYQSEFPIKKTSTAVQNTYNSAGAFGNLRSLRTLGKSYADAVRTKRDFYQTPSRNLKVGEKPTKWQTKKQNVLETRTSKQNTLKADQETTNKHESSDLSMEFFTSDLETQWLDIFFLGTLKSFDFLDSIQLALSEEGYDNCLCKHLGGLQVLIECDSFSQRNRLLLNGGSCLGDWFDWVGPWSKDSSQIDRFCWLVCRGVPLNVWNWKTFHSTGSHFGEVLKIDQNTEARTTLAAGRIWVRLNHGEHISTNLQISVNGDKVWIQIEEECQFSGHVGLTTGFSSSASSSSGDEELEEASDNSMEGSIIEQRSYFKALQALDGDFSNKETPAMADKKSGEGSPIFIAMGNVGNKEDTANDCSSKEKENKRRFFSTNFFI